MTLLSTMARLRNRRVASAQGFSTMEALVVTAGILVLATIAAPVYSTLRMRTHKGIALERFRSIGAALSSYTAQNGGMLPEEDADGTDSWDRIAKPAAKDAWYNALPRALGRKGAGELSPQEFYSEENLLFLPGANYPDKKKFIAPQFVIAFNTKLHRNNPATGAKQRLKMDQIATPARTVALLEQGCLNEDRTLEVQSRNDYDGSPKGSAKSFVGRYGGLGVLLFLDGHAELTNVKDTLTETGSFPYPQSDVIWTSDPNENPNKGAAQQAAAKNSKS